MARILDWDGENLPPELRELPAGRYVVERVDVEVVLSAEQEAGLEDALSAVDARDTGSSAEELRAELGALLRR